MKWLEEITAKYPTKSFDRNEIILYQGIEPPCVYVIKSGLVKGYDISAQGNEQLLWLGTAHDILPIPWIFTQASQTLFFYEAFSDTELYCIPKVEFLKALYGNHDATKEALSTMAGKYTDLLHRLNAVEKPKATEKIVHTLHFLARRFGRNDTALQLVGQQEIAVPLTHQDIANLLGLTRETIAVELKKLKDGGYIYYDKWRFIVYKDKLQSIL